MASLTPFKTTVKREDRHEFHHLGNPATCTADTLRQAFPQGRGPAALALPDVANDAGR